jgi:carbon-monoxide dehydrogenase small subunit
MKPRMIRFTLNGEQREVSVYPNDLLLNVIRDREHLTGTKYGCGIGECGTCTVHIDGQPMLSCLVLAVSVEGCEVVTIEGLARKSCPGGISRSQRGAMWILHPRDDHDGPCAAQRESAANRA